MDWSHLVAHGNNTMSGKNDIALVVVVAGSQFHHVVEAEVCIADILDTVILMIRMMMIYTLFVRSQTGNC